MKTPEQKALRVLEKGSFRSSFRKRWRVVMQLTGMVADGALSALIAGVSVNIYPINFITEALKKQTEVSNSVNLQPEETRPSIGSHLLNDLTDQPVVVRKSLKLQDDRN